MPAPVSTLPLEATRELAPVDRQVSLERSTLLLQAPRAGEIVHRFDGYAVYFAYAGGACDVAQLDGRWKRRYVRSNTALFALPGREVRFRQVEPIELLVIAVEQACFGAAADQVAAPHSWSAHEVSDVDDEGVTALCLEMRRSLLADGPLALPYLDSLVGALIARLTCQFLVEPAGGPSLDAIAPATFARIVGHLDAHMGEPIRVSELAALAGLSRSHFSRAFQKMTGDPPQRFVMKRRLCRARDLIIDGRHSLSDVAALTGFASQSHLTHAFRAEFGTSPGRYRSQVPDAEATG